MADITKTAYSSGFYYPEILYNQSHNISAGGTLPINHNLGFVPYFRVWGELFDGEYSSLWADSAQYTFMTGYWDFDIYGFAIRCNSNTLTIESFNASTKTVYVRMYRRG